MMRWSQMYGSGLDTRGMLRLESVRSIEHEYVVDHRPAKHPSLLGSVHRLKIRGYRH